MLLTEIRSSYIRLMPLVLVLSFVLSAVSESVLFAQATAGDKTTVAVPNDSVAEQRDSTPKKFAGGAGLPHGSRITPAAKAFATVGDLVTNSTVSPDGKILVSMNSVFLPHGSQKLLQPVTSSAAEAQSTEQMRKLPRHFVDGADLPNGWRITPAGKSIATLGDMVLNLVSCP